MARGIHVTADDVKQYIFGVADGLTSALGVVIPLAIAGRPMFTVAFGLAICAAIGMGGGEYLSDKTGRWRSAAMMAIASFIGTLIPALPFLLLPYKPAAFVAALLCLTTAAIISEAKSRNMTRLRAYTQTVAVLLTASVSTTAFAFLPHQLKWRTKCPVSTSPTSRTRSRRSSPPPMTFSRSRTSCRCPHR